MAASGHNPPTGSRTDDVLTCRQQIPAGRAQPDLPLSSGRGTMQAPAGSRQQLDLLLVSLPQELCTDIKQRASANGCAGLRTASSTFRAAHDAHVTQLPGIKGRLLQEVAGLVSRMPRVRDLTVDCTGQRDLAPLSTLTQLSSLHVSTKDSQETVISSGLHALTGLTALYLHANSSFSSGGLSWLVALSRLHTLSLRCNREDAGLRNGLPRLRQLRSLTLQGRPLSDLQPLSSLRSLIELDIQHCSKLTNLQPLAACTALTKLVGPWTICGPTPPLPNLQHFVGSWPYTREHEAAAADDQQAAGVAGAAGEGAAAGANGQAAGAGAAPAAGVGGVGAAAANGGAAAAGPAPQQQGPLVPMRSISPFVHNHPQLHTLTLGCVPRDAWLLQPLTRLPHLAHLHLVFYEIDPDWFMDPPQDAFNAILPQLTGLQSLGLVVVDNSYIQQPPVINLECLSALSRLSSLAVGSTWELGLSHAWADTPLSRSLRCLNARVDLVGGDMGSTLEAVTSIQAAIDAAAEQAEPEAQVQALVQGLPGMLMGVLGQVVGLQGPGAAGIQNAGAAGVPSAKAAAMRLVQGLGAGAPAAPAAPGAVPADAAGPAAMQADEAPVADQPPGPVETLVDRCASAVLASSPINALSGLTTLHLTCSLPGQPFNRKLLESLSGLTGLQELSVEVDNAADLHDPEARPPVAERPTAAPLASLTNLRSLELSGIIGPLDPAPLTPLAPSLTGLKCGLLAPGSCAALGALKKLEQLDVGESMEVASPAQLATLSRSLRGISFCHAYGRFDGHEDFHVLLSDMTALSSLTRLSSLTYSAQDEDWWRRDANGADVPAAKWAPTDGLWAALPRLMQLNTRGERWERPLGI